MEYYVAEINIAKMLAPIDSPVMLEFVRNLDRINKLAEESPGFVWRLKEESNNSATSIKVYDDDMIIVNMSVWKTIEDLYAYVYQSAHNEIFKRKKEWFEKMKERYMVMWYVSADKMPTVSEAVERLEYLRIHGETPHAFSFKKRFSVAESVEYKKE